MAEGVWEEGVISAEFWDVSFVEADEEEVGCVFVDEFHPAAEVAYAAGGVLVGFFVRDDFCDDF